MICYAHLDSIESYVGGNVYMYRDQLIGDSGDIGFPADLCKY